MVAQLQRPTGTVAPKAEERPWGGVLQAAVPLVALLATGAAGIGAVSLVGTGGRETTPPAPAAAPNLRAVPQAISPNVREGRTSWASSCPPLLDGHPSHRVVRTWVCPTT